MDNFDTQIQIEETTDKIFDLWQKIYQLVPKKKLKRFLIQLKNPN